MGYLCSAKWDWSIARIKAKAPDSQISKFAATFTVPAPPTQNAEQSIFLWLGMEPAKPTDPNQSFSPSILQPVLQWGTSGGVGGNFWSIAIWYLKGEDGNLDVAASTPPVKVTEGDALHPSIKRIILPADADAKQVTFKYLCEFEGIDDASLLIEIPDELVCVAIGMEGYDKSGKKDPDSCADLPASQSISFNSIQIIADGEQQLAPEWVTTTDGNFPCNIKATVAEHDGVQDQIDITYKISAA